MCPQAWLLSFAIFSLSLSLFAFTYTCKTSRSLQWKKTLLASEIKVDCFDLAHTCHCEWHDEGSQLLIPNFQILLEPLAF